MLSTKNKIRLAAAASYGLRGLRRLMGAGDIVDVERHGLRWRLDLAEGIDIAIFLFGKFEPTTVAACGRLVQTSHVVLDIGANIGAHTLWLARMVGESGKVYAFEPTAYAFRKLSQNLALNPVLQGQVIAEQVMLVDRMDTAVTPEIYSSWPLNGGENLHAAHLGRPESTAGARSETLESYTAGFARIDLIKLDVDGFECQVLEGGMGLLKKHKPIIVMELAPYVLEERGASLEQLLGLLSQGGYALYHLDGATAIAPDPARLRAMIPHGASLNIVARPRE